MSNRLCHWWYAYTFDHPGRRLFHKPEILLAPYVRSGMTALDLGCGMGFFSIGMAKLVGENGKVISADVQQKMLDILIKRADRKGVRPRIRTHQCKPTDLDLQAQVDFALAFWMLHELPDPTSTFAQLCQGIKPGANFLIAEPWFHVSKRDFERTVQRILDSGFSLSGRPAIRLSRSALFRRD